ncbi:P-loop containing nucleoside triphosphate hydrolase protein [Mycena olivaceomarginata]|nr:P-loop containing nucleoside triphosphate hydrolase protein [Mycena olivaceomarginata]
MDVKEIKERSSNPSIAAFSKNLVCVDLEGPDLTDFSALNPPGLIQNAASDIVRLVEEMVVDHISGNCLILVAIPMTDDIENQKALSLARQQDPNGTRTIGVLTKPDLLSRGSASRQLWLDVVEGRRHQLHRGYFCTRQPDDEERVQDIPLFDARQKEASFFSQTTPWSTSTRKQQFGVENLLATLSSCLVEMIGER